MAKIEQPKSPDSAVWQAALKASAREVLTFDRAAVRKALREGRERRGVAVPYRLKSVLP